MPNDHSHLMSVYWAWWATATLTGFLLPEIAMLIAGRPEDTLSAQIWRAEAFLPGQSILAWNAFHFLFIALLLTLDLWLLGHFGWGLWR